MTLQPFCEVAACEFDGLVFRVSNLIYYVSVVITKTSEVEG